MNFFSSLTALMNKIFVEMATKNVTMLLKFSASESVFVWKIYRTVKITQLSNFVTILVCYWSPKHLKNI